MRDASHGHLSELMLALCDGLGASMAQCRNSPVVWRDRVEVSREQAIHVQTTPITFALGNNFDINAPNTTAARPSQPWKAMREVLLCGHYRPGRITTL
jgi:hypothetical protein